METFTIHADIHQKRHEVALGKLDRVMETFEIGGQSFPNANEVVVSRTRGGVGTVRSPK